MSQTYTYDPEHWLISFMRSLGEYVKEHVPNSVYEVVWEFPSTAEPNVIVPEQKSLIHFEIDDIETRPLGFGNNYFRDNFNAANSTVRPQEARVHLLDLDVGIWAWDKSGGTTARLKAYESLMGCLGGYRAHQAAWEATTSGDGGVEILSFTGGRFLTERIGDMIVYRVVDGTLRVRLYSRTPIPAEEPAIAGLNQFPDLSIYVP